MTLAAKHSVPTARCPGGHVQLPIAQDCPLPHARPHAPQCAVLLRVSTSHPLPALLSQLPKPALHTKPQVLAAQYAAAAFAGVAHARSHAPQCRGSLASVAQVPEQLTCVD